LGKSPNWVDPDVMMVSDTLGRAKDGIADAGTLDQVQITAKRPSAFRRGMVNTFWAFDRAVGIDSYPSGSGTATVGYEDVRTFNNELATLPYGVGLAYSLTAGSLLDASVGFGELFDEGNLGSGALKIAAIVPLGRGATALRVGSKWKMLGNQGSRKGIYDGVKEASNFLREAGVPRKYRKQILESFEKETISLMKAPSDLYGLRFYDNVGAFSKGRYLFPTFTNSVNRVGLALPHSWNKMTKIAQHQIRPGSSVILGRAGSQVQMGSRFKGGNYQMYVNDLSNLIP